MIIHVAILCLGLGIGVFFALRSRIPQMQLLPAIGFWGALCVVSAILNLTWLTTVDANAICIRAEWLAKQAEVLDTLRQIPGADNLFPPSTAITPDTVIIVLHSPATRLLEGFMENTTAIVGISMIRLLLLANPLLGVTLLICAVTALVSALINFGRLVSDNCSPVAPLRLLSIVAGLSVVYIVISIPQIHSLGVTDDLKLRVFMILAEARGGVGPWWAAFGMALVAMGSIIEWMPDESNAEHGVNSQGGWDGLG